MLGHHRPVSISETPFKRIFAGRPMMARFKCYLDSLCPHKKNNNNKNVVGAWQNFLDVGLYK